MVRLPSEEGWGWRLTLRLIEGEKERELWITLAISKVFKRFADRGRAR